MVNNGTDHAEQWIEGRWSFVFWTQEYQLKRSGSMKKAKLYQTLTGIAIALLVCFSICQNSVSGSPLRLLGNFGQYISYIPQKSFALPTG